MMSPTTPDIQLEYELQDLYISSKHWLSDIAFITHEISFFHNILDKYLKADIQSGQGAQMRHCNTMLHQIQTETMTSEIRVIAYLNFLEPFIKNAGKKIGTDLIERHSLLRDQIAVLFESVRLLKKDIFALTEDTMNNEKNLFI